MPYFDNSQYVFGNYVFTTFSALITLRTCVNHFFHHKKRTLFATFALFFVIATDSSH